MNRRTLSMCAIAVSLAALAPGSPADLPTIPSDAGNHAALRARLKSEGWTEVEPHLFEKREHARVHTIAVGPAIRTHAQGQLRKQYDALRRGGTARTAETREALDGIRRLLGAITRSIPTGSSDACQFDIAVETGPRFPHFEPASAYARHFNSCGPGGVYTSVRLWAGRTPKAHSCADEGWHLKECESVIPTAGTPGPCYFEAYAAAYDGNSGFFWSVWSSGGCR